MFCVNEQEFCISIYVKSWCFIEKIGIAHPRAIVTSGHVIVVCHLIRLGDYWFEKLSWLSIIIRIWTLHSIPFCCLSSRWAGEVLFSLCLCMCDFVCMNMGFLGICFIDPRHLCVSCAFNLSFECTLKRYYWVSIRNQAIINIHAIVSAG